MTAAMIMVDATSLTVGGIGSGAALVWVALKLRELFSASRQSVANDDGKTDLLATLRIERDQALERADKFAEDCNKAYSRVNALEVKIGELQSQVDRMIETLKERDEHVETLVALLDHLLFKRPISEDMRNKLRILQSLGTLTDETTERHNDAI